MDKKITFISLVVLGAVGIATLAGHRVPFSDQYNIKLDPSFSHVPTKNKIAENKREQRKVMRVIEF